MLCRTLDTQWPLVEHIGHSWPKDAVAASSSWTVSAFRLLVRSSASGCALAVGIPSSTATPPSCQFTRRLPNCARATGTVRQLYCRSPMAARNSFI
eukprot:CAMPEP_0183342234 /NCGR_PEP_ID=MMETSP0164_2-20130417/8379_1 /TAXON_ID=221442 /ORGANISM="Coccolithus pelagicus ssp braarudi, Strain PLY182g" /LENGTH=95 /DNA_ID=CAMNT_0025512759 /DNA_START=496 /DNA_END=780 /DNA_ORIENTATION=-